MKIIELDIKSFSYNKGRSEISSLSGQNLYMEKGEKVAVIGPSGCGKSTLLKIISGMENLEHGSIKVNGKISFILQEYGLFPWKKVYNNIELPLLLKNENKRYKKEEIKSKVENIARALGIESILNSYPDKISGGQRQRVAIARALITDPDVLLMDEPFSSLDSLTRESIQDLVIKITDERKMSVVIVTHNIEESVYISDKVLIMGKDTKDNIVEIDRKNCPNMDFRGTEEYYRHVNIIRNELRKIAGGEKNE